MDRTLGPYQTDESLGAHPLGDLLSATHPGRADPIALLVLPDALTRDHRFRGLLRLEVARAGSLRHPAVARIVEVAEHSGQLYVVFERPRDHRPLQELMDSGQSLGPDPCVALVRRLAEVLDAAHGRRLVHGLLGPATILLGPDRSEPAARGAALLGVGLLAAVDEAGLAAVVRERLDLTFLAPEQVGGRLAVASADGYALGALARTLLGAAAGAASTVLDRQTSATPADRYPSCVAFAEALATALAGPPATGAPTGPVPVAPGPAAEPAHPPGHAVPAGARTPLPGLTAEPPATPVTGPDVTTPERAAPTAIPASPVPPEPVAAALGAPTTHTPTTHTPTTHTPTTHTPTTHTPTTHAPAAPRRALPDAAPALGMPAPPVPPPPPDDPVVNVLRSIFDQASPAARPTRPAAPGAETAGVRRPAGPSASAARIEPTPAMLATLERSQSTDPLGDGLAWLGARFPGFGRLLDRISTDGKIRSVPVGVAAAGVVAVLAFLVGSFLLGTAILALVAVLYLVPRLIQRVTGEAPTRGIEVVRVTGPVRLIRRVAVVEHLHEIDLPEDRTLPISRGLFAALVPHARTVHPMTPFIPSGLKATPSAELVLDGATLTYAWPSRLLFEILGADGAVLFRHPDYAGEPGQPGTPPPRPTRPNLRPGLSELDVVPRANPTWRRVSSRGQVITLQMPAEVWAAMRRSAQAAGVRLGIGLVLAVLFLVGTTLAGVGELGLFAVLAAAVVLGSRLLDVGLSQYHVQAGATILRVVGPISVTEHRANTREATSSFRVRLENDETLAIDHATWSALTRNAVERFKEDASGWQFHDGTQRLAQEHVLERATVTYEPTAPFLLEILGPSGQLVYRDPALRGVDIKAPPPPAS